MITNIHNNNILFLLLLCLFNYYFIKKAFSFQINTTILNEDKKYDFTINNFRKLEAVHLNIIDQTSTILIPLCIGFPHSQCFNFIFDTGSFGLWVKNHSLSHSKETNINKYFDVSQSTTYKSFNTKVDFKYVTGIVNGTLSSDIISINNTNLNIFYNDTRKTNVSILFNLTFTLVDNLNINNKYISGISGFAKTYLDLLFEIQTLNKGYMKTFSIIHQLFDNKYISKLIFAYKQQSTNSGILYLGETGINHTDYPKCFPQYIPETLNEQKHREIIYSKYYWTCKIYNSSLSDFNKLSKYHYYQVFIDSGANAVTIPEPFYNSILNDYVLFSEGKCFRNEIMKHALFCSNGLDIKILPVYTLNLYNFTLELLPQDLLMFVSKVEDHDMYINKFISEESDNFIIGANIIKRYHFIFNMHDKSIGAIVNTDFNLLDNVTLFHFTEIFQEKVGIQKVLFQIIALFTIKSLTTKGIIFIVAFISWLGIIYIKTFLNDTHIKTNKDFLIRIFKHNKYNNKDKGEEMTNIQI